jgi:hypothetical protein
VVISNKIYGIVLSLPFVLSTVYYVITPGQQTFLSSILNSSKIFSQVDEAKGIASNSTNITKTSSIKSGDFLMDFNSGDRSIYERKSIWGSLQWGDKFIPIYGNITSISSPKLNIANRTVMIQALQNDKVIYEKFVTTGKQGNFSAFFYPPEDGIVKVVAKVINGSASSQGLITVIATQAWAPAIIISIFITLSIASSVIFWGLYKKHDKDPQTKQPVENPFYLRIGLIPTVIFTLLSYIILYKFPPLEAAGNAAIATALIGPIAASVIESIRK